MKGFQSGNYEMFIEMARALAATDADYAYLKEKINSKEQKLVDQTIEFTAFAGADTTVDLTPDGLNTKKGVRTLTGNKLQPSNFFMPFAFQLLGGVLGAGETGTDTELQAASFGHIEDVSGAEPNGYLNIKNDSRVILPDVSLWKFANKGLTNERKGIFYLNRSFLFKPDSEFNIDLYALSTTTLKAFKLIMHGIGTATK